MNRSRSKLELEASRDKYHDLFDFAPIGCFTIDEGGIIREMNLTGASMLGVKRGSAIGQSLTRFIHREDQEVFCLRRRRLERPGRGERFELRLVRSDGSGFPAQMNCVSMLEREGAASVRVAVTDLSERMTMEEELRRSRDALRARTTELEQKNKVLQEFAFFASHDLREPLRKIQTFGAVLERRSRDLDDRSRDCVSRMAGAAGRMQELLEALLRYSRVETRGQGFTPVKLEGIVREVGLDLEHSLRRTGGRLEVGILPEIQGDPFQLRQLFQNLIANALKYHRPEVKPLVRVLGSGSNGTFRVSVEDNGIGFDEKYVDIIFQPFQRLHGRSEYPGTGMGLAICRKIVERHGGTITAKSTPGKGSRFVLAFPRPLEAGGRVGSQ